MATQQSVQQLPRHLFVIANKGHLLGQLYFSVLALFMTITIAGCAMGTNVMRPVPDELTLGVTTKEAVLGKYGTPDNTGETEVNGKLVDVVGYTFVDPNGRTHIPGVNASRNLMFNFYNNKLVGYIFTSSFQEDHTDFEASKIEEIKKGVTKKSDVIALLGDSNGKEIYPMIENKDSVRFLYQYFHFDMKMGFLKAKGKIYTKLLTVDFDSNGTVTDTEYSTKESKI